MTRPRRSKAERDLIAFFAINRGFWSMKDARESTGLSWIATKIALQNLVAEGLVFTLYDDGRTLYSRGVDRRPAIEFKSKPRRDAGMVDAD
jgi:hypothetical protein